MNKQQILHYIYTSLKNSFVGDKLICDYDDYPYYVDEETIRYDHGASKLVFTNLDSRFVYKVPYAICLKDDGVDLEDFDFSHEKYDFDELDDHCLKEVDAYENAVRRGLEKVFAKSELFGYLENGCPVYRQVKVVPREYKTILSKPRKKRLERMIVDLFMGIGELDTLLSATFFSHFGYEFCKRLEAFIDDYDLNDIGDWNIGLTRDRGEPVIFDYSGFLVN